MRPGEIVVARLSKGPTIARYLKASDRQVSVSVGRNRQARIPPERILLQTGLVVSGEEEVEDFRKRCGELASGIDLSAVWEVAVEDLPTLTIEDVSDLFWGEAADPIRKAAMALHMEHTDYFSPEKTGYKARSRQAIVEIQERRRREALAAEAISSLVSSLSEGRLPEPITQDHKAQLEHLRGYAIFGDDYLRSHAARTILDRVSGSGGDPQRRCFELMAEAGVLSADEPLELHRAEIRTDFPPEALSEAASIGNAALATDPGRNDLTGLLTVTIDEADSVDRDDALSVQVKRSNGGPGKTAYSLVIHITDAGALIPAGGPIDQEADRRMGTLYVPDGTVHMLPPELVGRAGSLDPGEDRATMSLEAEVDGDGEVLDWQVVPALIRSDYATTYGDAGRNMDDAGSPLHESLSHMAALSAALKLKRLSLGAVDFERAEMSIKVRESGEVEVRVLQRPDTAREMVAELMILCNSLLAAFCSTNQIPAVYRCQQAPDTAGVAAVMEAPEGPFRRFLLIRLIRPVEMDTVPAPHSALGAQAYIQATSPLRRYADLVMQRQISHFLSEGKHQYSKEEVASVAQRSAMQMRELAQLEEQRKRYWFMKYLRQTHLEQPDRSLLPAVVLENPPNRHALLELADYPFRVRAEVPRIIDAGERVTLKLHGVDLWRRAPSLVYQERAT